MAKSKTSIARTLHEAQVAIENSLNNPVILTAVARFGYSEEKLVAGRTLYEAAVEAVQRQKSAAGDQQIATANLYAAQKVAITAFQDLAKVARAIFVKTPASLVTLGLDQAMPRALGPFIVAAYRLFQNAALEPELGNFGYDDARLAEETAKIAACEQANLLQESAKGDAQQATQEQGDALKELSDWIAQYRKIARVALRDNPQALEKIGIIVRSAKTAAQCAGAIKAAATRTAKKAADEHLEPELV